MVGPRVEVKRLMMVIIAVVGPADDGADYGKLLWWGERRGTINPDGHRGKLLTPITQINERAASAKLNSPRLGGPIRLRTGARPQAERSVIAFMDLCRYG